MDVAKNQLYIPRMYVILFICLAIPVLSTAKIKKAENCPRDLSAWEGRARTFNCSDNKQYHCLLDDTGILYELCLKKFKMLPQVDGCPIGVGLAGENPYFALPPSECPENITGCPKKGDEPYYTNELYKYPICFVPEKERYEYRLYSSSTASLTTLHVHTEPEKEDSKSWISAVVVVAILFAVAILVIVILFKFWSKIRGFITRKRRSRSNEESSPEQVVQLLEDERSVNPVGHTEHVLETPADVDLPVDSGRTTAVSVEQMEGYDDKDEAKPKLEIHDSIGASDGKAEKEEWTCPCYQKLMTLKQTIWIHLGGVKGEKSWKEFFGHPDVKHSLYHQWKNVICCSCESTPEIFRRRFISNEGWNSLYELCEKECPNDYDNCSCKYQQKDIDVRDISIATLLCIVYSVGQLTRNGKRCVTEIRQCCEKIMQMDLPSVPDEVINDLKSLLSSFEINSKFTGKAREDSKYSQEVSCEAKDEFAIDIGDLSPLEVNEVNEETLSKFTARTREFLKEDPFYVPVSRWEKEAKKKMYNDRFLIVTGYIGEGKSTLCREILRHFTEKETGHDVIALKLEPNQVKFRYLHQLGRPCLIYFEDFLGTSQYTKLYSKEKSTFYKECLESIKRFKDISVICCVRSVVLEEARSELLKIKDPSEYIMDLSSNFKLTKEEILHQLDTHQKEYTAITLSEEEKGDIASNASKDNFFGFLECCALCFKSKQGERVFYHPEKEIEKEIERLQEQKNFEYYILVYILLKNTPLNMNNVDYDILNEIEGDLALGSLKKRKIFTFLRKVADNAYSFQHQFILEAVLKVFGRKDTEKLLSLAADEVVLMFLRPSSYKPRNKQEVFLCLIESYDAKLARRLLKATNYRNISVHVATRDRDFVKQHVLPALEESLLARLREISNLEELAAFVQNTIRDVVTEAASEGNETFLECFIQHYTELPFDGKKGEAVVDPKKLNGMTRVYQIAKCFSDCLTQNYNTLPKSIQQQAADLQRRFTGANGLSQDQTKLKS